MQVLSRTRYSRCAAPFKTQFSKIQACKPLAIATGFALVAGLGGCSLVSDRSADYVGAPEGKTIELPASADESRFRQVMPVRDINLANAGKLFPDGIPTPPDMTSEILDQNYAVEELDGRAWLLVNDVPGRLWPAVTAYMSDRRLGVAFDSPQLGLQQSELVNFSLRARELVQLEGEASASEPKVLLQVRIAPGVRRKSTEIQMRNIVVADQPEALLSWDTTSVPAPADLELQKRLLADMGEFLKAGEENKSFSRAASGMTNKPLVKLISENERASAIDMQLDYGRAWAEVSRALNESDMTIIDLNRSEGWFQVDYRSADERESGWFSWFSWFSDNEAPRHTHTVNVTRGEQTVQVSAETAVNDSGEQTPSTLLNRLFDYLY
ncbi:outer membrane protein assembly factor BamC [Marinobacter gelidimuriae]|uniref:outer membrane protein assembly factor BamC n=1 Tax=Marinobacter gelidimuriae TaxID=2739064 RepID=UPI00036846BB